MSKPVAANLLPVGSNAWVPASCTQLFYHIPTELDLNPDAKLSFLPVTVRSYDADNKVGYYQLAADWDDKVVVKCSVENALPRSEKTPLKLADVNQSSDDLSHLDYVHDASIVWELMMRYKSQNYHAKVGSSACIILLNPLDSDTRLFSVPRPVSPNRAKRTGRRSSIAIAADMVASDPSHMMSKEGQTFVLAHEDLHVFSAKIWATLSASDQNYSHAIMMQGCSGSGKSEAFKGIAQYFLQRCSTLPNATEVDLNPKSEIFQCLGSSACPFIIPNDAEYAGAIALGVRVLELFGSAPSSRHRLASRHLKKITLAYDARNNLTGATFEMIYIDMHRLCHRGESYRPYMVLSQLLASCKRNEAQMEQYHFTSSLIREFASGGDDEADANEFEYFIGSLLHLGMDRQSVFEVMDVLAACVHIASIAFESSNDVAILSSNASMTLNYAEELLGIDSNSLQQIFLVKVDEKIGSLRGTQVDCSVAEAIAARNMFCHEIYSRVVIFLLDFCSQTIATASKQSIEGTSSLIRKTIHLVDPPGWEIVSSHDYVNGIQQLNINYIHEKSTGYYISSCFMSHMKKYADNPEEIFAIRLPTNSQTLTTGSSYFIPECAPFIDLFDKPSTGLISVLEEVCQALRGDDKIFTDKILSIHARSKQIRSTGHKSSNTSFVVRHTFGDLTYDAAGFVLTNKNKLSIQAKTLIATMPSQIVLSSTSSYSEETIDSMYSLDELLAMDAANAIQESSTSTLPERKVPRKSSSMDKNAPKNIYQLSKSREAMNKLCAAMDNITASSFVLCVRPCQPSDGFFDPEFVSAQVRALYLSSLAQLMKSGYSYCKTYQEFYVFFRAMLPPFHRLPPTIPRSATLSAAGKQATATTNESNSISATNDATPAVKAFCRSLLQECMAISNISLSIYDSGVSSANKDSHLILFSKRYVCLKERAENILMAARTKAESSMNKVITKLKSKFRMRVIKRSYRKVLRSIIKIQSFRRGYAACRRFRQTMTKIRLLQRYTRMFLCRFNYREICRAAKVIKSFLFHKMRQKIRYARMRRVVVAVQHLARGYLLRQQAIYVAKAVEVIRSSLKSYIHRVRLYRRKEILALEIQRVFRGYLTRIRQSRVVHVLELRRKQRIAQKVTIMLQSKFRRRYICKRFRRLRQCTVNLQLWIRARFQRKRFLLMKTIAVWLQKNWRRMQAIRHVSNIRMTTMVLLEETKVWKYRSQELAFLENITTSKWDETQGSWAIGNVTYRNGRTKCTRRIVGFDAHFDLSEVYPNRWIRTVMEFSDRLKRLEKKTIVDVAVGGEHTILVDNSANFYSFGSGDSGQLGHGNRHSLAVPMMMETMELTVHASEASMASGNPQHTLRHTTVVSICCGRAHTLLLTGSGKMYSWGSNKRGQLGHSHFEASTTPRMVGQDLIESAFNKNAAKNAIISRNIKQISCGAYHSACIADPGYLYTWGAGACLGRVQRDFDQENRKNMAQAKGAKITMTGRKDASMTCPDCSEPTVPPYFSKRRVQYVLCGDAHVIVRSNCEFFSWGRNAQGQLGIGDYNDTLLPSNVHLPVFQEADASTSILCTGGRHNALLVKGKLWCWGWNSCGQIGDGTMVNAAVPTAITVAERGIFVKQVVAGWQYTAVVTSLGDPYIWGSINLWNDFFPNSFYEANEMGRKRHLTPQHIEIPESIFGRTVAFVSLNSPTMSVLAVDSEDFSAGRCFPTTEKMSSTSMRLRQVNASPGDSKQDEDPPSPQLRHPWWIHTTDRHATPEKSRHQTASGSTEEKYSSSQRTQKQSPFRTTASSKDISQNLLRFDRTGPIIADLLKEKLGAGIKFRKTVESTSSFNTLSDTSKADGKGSSHSQVTSRPSDRVYDRDKEGKLQDGSIMEYFSFGSSKKINQSRPELLSGTSVFTALSSLNPDLALTSEEREEFDRLKNTGRGINMPTTERNILLKFTNQRREMHVKHLNELLPGAATESTDDHRLGAFERQTKASSDPSKISARQLLGPEKLTESQLGLSPEGVRSLNNAIDSLRLDIRQLESIGPKTNKRNAAIATSSPNGKGSKQDTTTMAAKQGSSDMSINSRSIHSPRGISTRLVNGRRKSDAVPKNIRKSIDPRQSPLATDGNSSNQPPVENAAEDTLNAADVRDLAVLLQSIKRENIQQIAGSWKY